MRGGAVAIPVSGGITSNRSDTSAVLPLCPIRAWRSWMVVSRKFYRGGSDVRVYFW